MSRRYDSRTTTFSPEGRLYQVEYAMEAINHAGTCIAVISSEGILLAAERKVTSRLLDQPSTLATNVAAKFNQEKLFQISDDIWCAVAGVTSDANILIDWARSHAAKWRMTYGEPVPLEQLVEAISNLKQSYTQHGGMRPFGSSFLYAGWDKQYGYQLYQSDPSGNYSGWKATCIGGNSSTAQSMFKTEYDPQEKGAVPTMLEAKKMVFKILSKTVESGALAIDKLELVTLVRGDRGATCVSFLEPGEVQALIREVNPTASRGD